MFSTSFSAFNLRERADLPQLAIPLSDRAKADRARARERISWWRKEFHGGRESTFRRWLQLAGYPSTAEALAVVETDHVARFQDKAPAWLDWLNQAHAGWSTHNLTEVQRRARAEQSGSRAIVDPYVELARRRIGQALDQAVAHGLSMDRAKLENDIIGHIGSRLFFTARGAAALSLNVERLRGGLAGQTSEDRAADFALGLLSPSRRRALLQDYPVLDRKLAQASLAMTIAAEEMIQRLSEDHVAVREHFGLGDSPVTALQCGQGDPHKFGRSVAIVEFGSGKVVYKPRSMAVDEAFQGLLRWLGERIDDAPEPQRVIDCGDHGWAEFIDYRPCQDAEAVARAYRRMGALLAVLNLCGATDLHYENLIFRGDSPFAIDLETVMTGRPRFGGRGAAASAAQRVTRASLHNIGFLPAPTMGPGGRFDLSAGGLVREQASPIESSIVDSLARDDARAVMRRAVMAPRGNVVRLDGVLQPPGDHLDALVKGFRLAYGAFQHGKPGLLDETGPLEPLRRTTIRWVPRPTLTYALMQVRANHPTFLRDGLDQDMAFSELWTDAEGQPHLLRILESEYADLWQGDVPYFVARADAHDAQDSRGQIIVGLFEESGYQALTRQVGRLSSADLERQVAVLKTAFIAAQLDRGPEQPSEPILTATGASRPDLAERCQAEAQRIGDYLIRSAWIEGHYPFWFGISSIDKTAFRAELAGPDLYSGLGGIGVFFAALARTTGEPRFEAMARRCLTGHRASPPAQSAGGYVGAAGLLYAELRMAEGFDVSAAFVRKQLRSITQLVEADEQYDVVSGAAGAILGCLAAARRPAFADEALAAALRCAAHLEARASRTDGVATWTPARFETPMTGFSHGAAGIAYALAALARATGERRHSQLAWEALAFETAHFDVERGLWRDARPDTPAGTAWCHGAPGITIGRQAIANLGLPDAPGGLTDEIALGLEACARIAAGGSHCLCHGAAGNIEPFIDGGADHQKRVAGLAERMLDEIRTGGWRSGYDGYVEAPGLMTGLAGIGYGLLRISAPETPSVLRLDG